MSFREFWIKINEAIADMLRLNEFDEENPPIVN